MSNNQKPIIKGKCIWCGLCANLYPDVFKMNNSGTVDVIDIPEYDAELVTNAINGCPVGAIAK